MFKLFTVGILASALVLAGCDTISKRDTGMGLGAVVGGVAGSQFGRGTGNVAATIVGAAVGAYLGSRIGSNMDNNDRSQVYRSLDDGRHHSWVNNNTGNRYAVTPESTYQNNDGQYCRAFHQTGVIAGRHERLKGVACKQPDGSWRIVSAQ